VKATSVTAKTLTVYNRTRARKLVRGPSTFAAFAPRVSFT